MITLDWPMTLPSRGYNCSSTKPEQIGRNSPTRHKDSISVTTLLCRSVHPRSIPSGLRHRKAQRKAERDQIPHRAPSRRRREAIRPLSSARAGTRDQPRTAQLLQAQRPILTKIQNSRETSPLILIQNRTGSRNKQVTRSCS